MKLTNNKKTQLKPGMTLIELTVVILVLLTLISVLFIGAQAYKNAADRSACILNIRNTHQGVRAHQNTSGAAVGDTFDRTDVIDEGKFVETEPLCPTNGSDVTPGPASYTVAGSFPPVGTCAVECARSGGGDAVDENGDPIADYEAELSDHTPTSTSGW